MREHRGVRDTGPAHGELVVATQSLGHHRVGQVGLRTQVLRTGERGPAPDLVEAQGAVAGIGPDRLNARTGQMALGRPHQQRSHAVALLGWLGGEKAQLRRHPLGLDG